MSFLKILYTKNNTDIYDLIFRVSMLWRILYGCLRLILGFILLRLINAPLSDIFYTLMNHELIEDPTDILIRAASPLFQHLSFTVTYFIAAYLIFWGLLDIFLSVNLLRERHWAYTTSIALIGAFVAYEIVRVWHTHSLILAGIIIVDLFILYLIRVEQKRHSRV